MSRASPSGKGRSVNEPHGDGHEVVLATGTWCADAFEVEAWDLAHAYLDGHDRPVRNQLAGECNGKTRASHAGAHTWLRADAIAAKTESPGESAASAGSSRCAPSSGSARCTGNGVLRERPSHRGSRLEASLSEAGVSQDTSSGEPLLLSRIPLG